MSFKVENKALEKEISSKYLEWGSGCGRLIKSGENSSQRLWIEEDQEACFILKNTICWEDIRHFFGLYYFRSVLISLHSFTLSSVYPLFSREVRFESIIPLFTPPLALKFTETRSQFFTRALKLYLLHPHYLLTTSSATLFHDLLYPRGILLLLRRAPITLLPMAFPLAVPSACYTLSLENDRTNSFSFLRICHPI